VAGLTEPDGSAPLISVVVTAYNRREYLKRAVDSVLCQTLPRDRYEVVVSKNFQTEFDDAWTSRNVRLVWFGQGGSGSRVADALRYCRGEVVCFLDDDDVYLPNKLETVNSAFVKNPELQYLTHNAYKVSHLQATSNRLVKTHKESSIILKPPYYEAPSESFMRNKLWGNNSTVAVRRSLMTRWLRHLSRIELAVDLFYFVCAMASNGIIMFLNRPLSIYMIHAENTSMLGQDAHNTNFLVNWRKYNLRTLSDTSLCLSMASYSPLQIYLKRNYLYHKLRLLMYESGRRREKVHTLSEYISLFGYKSLKRRLVLSAILSMLSPMVVLKVSEYLSRMG
jgi:Glycosyltransferases involved in cell wall biogenesis